MKIRLLISRLMGKKDVRARRDFEVDSFQRIAREQFLRLKDKGLSIPVVTL